MPTKYPVPKDASGKASRRTWSQSKGFTEGGAFSTLWGRKVDVPARRLQECRIRGRPRKEGKEAEIEPGGRRGEGEPTRSKVGGVTGGVAVAGARGPEEGRRRGGGVVASERGGLGDARLSSTGGGSGGEGEEREGKKEEASAASAAAAGGGRREEEPCAAAAAAAAAREAERRGAGNSGAERWPEPGPRAELPVSGAPRSAAAGSWGRAGGAGRCGAWLEGGGRL